MSKISQILIAAGESKRVGKPKQLLKWRSETLIENQIRTLLKTEENIDNQGFIARPTDQRLKFGILFQDYVPNIPDLKMYLNLIYNTGVPGGAPSYSNPYNYLNRLPDYKRADLGISYIVAGKNKKFNTGFRSLFEELTVGLEIFNMFDVQNSITNTWVRDVYSKRQFSIPNYLTPRIFNLNLEFKF